MKCTVCPECGKRMFDNDSSIRFKCEYCGKMFDQKEWGQELHEQIKEAVNISVQEKCECCPHMFEHKCRAEKCPYDQTDEKN